MTAFFIILGLLGIGLIIFVHEAGHFLAAKKVGVRVERFALGFDPPIGGRNLRFFSFTKGETEYVLGMIPFGGYVKLAGEALMEQGKEPAPDELLAKSVGARALVFAAGAAMNILSAVVLFVIAFSFGVTFAEPRIGDVLPGSPAWQAGLRSGDEVLAIDGKAVNDFTELFLASAFSGTGEELELTVARPAPRSPVGSPESETDKRLIRVRPEWSAAQGFRSIGVGPAKDAHLRAPRKGSVAAEAGLEDGDVLVGASVGGRPLPPLAANELLEAIETHFVLRPGTPLTLRILRNGEEKEIALTLRKDPEGEPRSSLQVSGEEYYSGPFVQDVAPESEARDVFRSGDRVVAIDGRPIFTLHWLGLADDFQPGKLRVDLESATGERRTQEVDHSDLLLWSLRHDVLWSGQRARIGQIPATSSMHAAGFEKDDLLVALGDSPVYGPEDLPEILARERGDKLTAQIRRGSNTHELEVKRAVFEELDGIRWRDFPPLSYVAPDGPAAAAGVTAGSRILKIGEQEIFGWMDLKRCVDELTPFTPVTVTWVDAAGTEHTNKVTVGVDPYEGPGIVLGDLRKVVRAGIVDSFVLGAERTVVVGKQVFLTLRSLLRSDVSARNLSGPVGITHAFTRVAELGLIQLIFWIAIVSVHLGLLNLLPFPILDGGHLFFLLIEKIKGSPVNLQVQEWAMRIAFLLIISLALFVTFHDLRRLFM